jgi:biotin synthase
LSIGDRSREDYAILKEAGVSGVLYRFETSNPELYDQLHPAKSHTDRLAHLRMMKDLGYVISTGCILGLPDQTTDDLVNDLLLMRELETFMPSFGPLVATKNTPLADVTTISFEQVLKFISACRLLMPTARIPVTTAMETLGGGETARQQCFLAGANSVMFNLTPEKYRQNYKIYDNKFFDSEKKYERWALFKGELSYEMMERELKISI